MPGVAEERGMVRVLAAANIAGLIVTLVGIERHLGWISASLAVGIGLALESLWIARSGFRRWSSNCWLFGLAAGLAELYADRWLVRDLDVLTYAQGGPFLLDSPLYMPFAWGGTLQTLVVLGMWLNRQVGALAASALTATAAGLYLPLYEHLAHAGGWWSYRGPRLLFGTTPWFIGVGEILIGAPLPLLGLWLGRVHPAAAALVGGAAGLWIFGAYAAAFALAGGGP